MENARAEVSSNPESQQKTYEDSGREAVDRVAERLKVPATKAKEWLAGIGGVISKRSYSAIGAGVQAGERVAELRQARAEEAAAKAAQDLEISRGFDAFNEHRAMAGEKHVLGMDALDHSQEFAAGWDNAKAELLKEKSDRETDEINEKYTAEKQEEKRLAKQQKADEARARRQKRVADRQAKRDDQQARRQQKKIDKLHGKALEENQRRDEEEAFRQEVESDHSEALEMNMDYDEGLQSFNELVDRSPEAAFEWTPSGDLPSYSEGWEAAKSKHIDGLHEEALKMDEQYDIDLAEEKYKELQAKAQRRAEEAQARKEARRARRQERLDTAKELPGRAMRKVGRTAGRGWKAFKASAKGAHEAAQQSLKETADA